MRQDGNVNAAAWTLSIVLAICASASCKPREAEAPPGNINRIQAIAEAEEPTEADLAFVAERLEQGVIEERSYAAWALGERGNESHAPLLMRAARDDEDLFVRVNAVEASGKLGGDGVEQLLGDMLAEADPKLQAAALRALGSDRYAAACAEVGELLVEGDAELRPLAAQTLAAMGAADGRPFLERALGDPSNEVRSGAAFGLGKLSDPLAIPALTRALEDEAWDVRANAVQALGMIGDRKAMPAVRRMLDDPREDVRIMAERSLDRLR